MIIFRKLPDNTWEKSGEVLPTEKGYLIAVDAEPAGGPNSSILMVPATRAVAYVEKLIAENQTGDHYRYELAMPPAKLLKRARRASERTVKRILDTAKTPSKAAPKTRHAGKHKAKETGKQRRARLIREGKCTACGKRKPRKGRRECKQCADYYAKWAAKKAGK